jgi:phosphatidylglycerophosphatase C
MMPRNAHDPSPGVALFDLDGSLLAWDTQVLFCEFVLRREGWRRLYLLVFLPLLPLAPILGAGGMKRVFLSYLWRVDAATLAGWVREFVAEWFPQRCFPEMLDQLKRQRRAGRRLILASASPEFYVREIGRALGFDDALGTPVESGGKMPLFPDLRNHKGGEKVRRLRELLGVASGLLPGSHGYSDSTADLPMLGLCEQVTVVNPRGRLECLAREHRWEIVRPVRPWRGSVGRLLDILRRMTGA